MTPKELLSIEVWATFLFVFLMIELPPVFWPGCPWFTLSTTSWKAEMAWHFSRALFLSFLIALTVHIVFFVPARVLIVTVAGAAVALGLHLFWRYVIDGGGVGQRSLGAVAHGWLVARFA